jgi:hypothetical protein
MKVCVESANHMKMFCYYVPFIPPLPPSGPGTVPPVDPPPFYRFAEEDSLPDAVQRELSTISAIDRLADGLPASIKDSVRKTIRGAATDHPGLPKGMSVRF